MRNTGCAFRRGRIAGLMLRSFPLSAGTSVPEKTVASVCFDRRPRQWQMHVAYNERITRKRFFRVQVQLNCASRLQRFCRSQLRAQRRVRAKQLYEVGTVQTYRARECRAMRDYSSANSKRDCLLQRRTLEIRMNAAILGAVCTRSWVH